MLATSILASATGYAATGSGLLSSCRALFATSFSAGSSTSAEEAIAEAWANIVLQADSPDLEEWSLAVLRKSARPDQDAWAKLFNPPTGLLDVAGRDGLVQLQEVVSLLLDEGTLMPSNLIRELESRAEAQVKERNRSRKTREENTQERRTVRDFVRVVPTPATIQSPILLLKSGRLAVPGGHHVVLIESDGSNPQILEFPYTDVHSVIQQTDGRITVGTKEGLMQSYDEAGTPSGEIRLPGHCEVGLLPLQDGGFVSANIWGTVSFVGPDHQIIAVTEAKTRISGTPIQLRQNKNVVVTDKAGCVSFFSPRGQLMKKTCFNYPMGGSALELLSGEVLAVHEWGKGMVFNADGDLLRQFGLEESPLMFVQLQNGTIALSSSQGKIHFLETTGKSTSKSYDAGSRITSPVSLLQNQTLAFATEDGNIHLIDETGALQFKFRRPETIYAPLMSGNDGKLIAGSDKGHLLFMDIDGLKSIGL